MANPMFYCVDLFAAGGLLLGSGGSHRSTRAALESAISEYRIARPWGADPTRARVMFGHRHSPGWYTLPDMKREGRADG